MFENICCLFYIFPTHVFLDIWSGSSPDASSSHEFEVSITPIGLSINPKQGPSSWSFSPWMVYFAVILCRGCDKRPLCDLMDTVILEGRSYGTSKFVQGYGNLCHYSYKIPISLCGHAWSMPSFTMCFDNYF